MKNIVVLRVGRNGEVLAQSDRSQELLKDSQSLRCSHLVAAKDSTEVPVCTETCATMLAEGRTSGNENCQVFVRNEPALLDCKRVGDEVVVVVRPTEQVVLDDAKVLSNREREVMSLVAQGLQSRAIADELGIRVSTVRTHVENARQKLGVRSRAQAVGRLGVRRVS